MTKQIGSALACALIGLAITPAAGKADDDQQGRKACMYDVLTVCAQFIPDRERIVDCLSSNRELISEQCRVLIVHARAEERAPTPDK
jgi:hypothetical protein